MKYRPQKGDYKQTGNLTMDTITAGINHYRRFGRQVTEVRLNHSTWKKFIEYMKKIDPSFTTDDSFDLDNITIRKGSILQIRTMQFEFEKIIVEA